MTNKTECDEDCKNPTPPPPAPPTPPSPAGKYACNFTDADPTYKKGTCVFKKP